MNPRLLVMSAVVCIGCLSPVAEPDAGTGGGSATGGGGGTTTGGGGGGTTTGGGGGGTTTGGGGGGTTTGGGGGSTCSPTCGPGRDCCGARCVNTANDPGNCGACGVTCSGLTPYCDNGTCTNPPCSLDAGFCQGGSSCCGNTCCGAGEICCEAQGPVSGFPTCFAPTVAEPTCPQGCSPLCQSDRNIKSNVRPIDELGVLEQVATLPLSTWQYTDDPSSTRHLGPMAQDFRATFGLGDTDRAYNSIDAHGVSLASIKALYRMVQDQQVRLEKLEAENARLRSNVCR